MAVAPVAFAAAHPILANALPQIISFIGSALLGRKKKKSSPSQSEQIAQQLLQNQMNTLNPLGQRLTGMGTDALSPAIQRFSRLTSGSRSDVDAEMAPEYAARNEADRSAIGSVNEFAPRGGVATDMLSRLPFQRIGEDVTNRSRLRSDAAGRLGAIGSGLIGSGLTAFGGARGASGDALDYYLRNSEQEYNRSRDAGAGLFDIFTRVFGAMNKAKTASAPIPAGGH